MASGGPMAMKELLSLTNVGVNPQFITFTNCTMESEKYICVRETGAQNQVVIIDTASPSTPLRRPITADSAIMNPEQKIIALKASGQGGDNLQIFNLDTKAKVKAHLMPEPVVFWKWITKDKIGMVTNTSVFHWDMTNEAPPTKVFVRTQNLQGTQIINYRVDAAEKWCVLIGIAAGAQERPQLVKGFMQLYSVEQQRSQALEAHAAAFATLEVPGGSPSSCISFATKTFKDGAITSKLHVIQLGAQPGSTPMKKQAELFFPNEFADDFPVAMQISAKYGLIYVLTKAGLLFVYDLETATAIYRNRVSQESIFLTTPSSTSGGVITINRSGKVHLLTPNDQTMVQFVSTSLNNASLAMAMAKRGNMPGADQLVVQEFEQLFSQGKAKEAAECAADSPQGILRTREVMDRLKAVPPQPGQKAPLLIYFGNLLAKGKLNAMESVELARLVVSQNKKDLLVNWMREGKLEPSEELGDLLQQHGENDLALQAFQSSGSQQKAVMAMAAKGDIESLVQYAGGSGVKPDYMYLLQSLMMSNPQGAVELAKKVAKEPGPPIEINTMADLFLQRNMIREATAFMLDALQDDRPEYGPLQTKLIEVNLISNPQVADAILGNNTMTHYDRPRIAQLCEKAGLFMRALQHYTDLPDIKRCIVNTHAIDPAALTEYFGSLSADWALACLKEMLVTNMQQNLQLAVQIAKEYTEQIGADQLITMFEQHDETLNGLFYYLGAYIAFSEDEDVHYKYIQAAAKTGNVKEVERHTRESSHYPPEKVKTFLMDTKLPDARPLINVCDRFDMVHDLTTYLYGNNMLRFIEGYVQRVNPANTAPVIGALLDLEAPDEFINNLILSVRALVPVGPLVEEVEKRNRLKLLTPFLEHLVSEGNQDVHVHNALGKIIIDTNNNPEHFLTTNPYYDSLVVGGYCEKRDPNLACVAYKRGLCDDALVACTNKHSLFKLQARYITERQEPELWAKVLSSENNFRRQLIDQVVSTALPESKNPEQVSTTVKAFMQADLQAELIELLEKIVLNNSSFASNSNLQNLLIITAIKADKTRVKDYIYRLDKFDGPAVGEIAVGYEMYEEAFEIYKKFGHKVLAIKVLMEHMEDYDRAHEYASKVDEPEVWSELGHAQLAKDLVKEAITSYLRAGDSSKFSEVIEKTKEAGCYADLVKYLQMVRRKIKDVKVDSELVYAFAKTDDLGALEEFISSPHQANLQTCGDRCFGEEMFEAARILFQAIPNWGRLASTLVRLRKFQEAVDAARKANSPRVWKEVCFACVDQKEFRLAQLCGLNIIINADDLEEVSQYYQERGYFEQIIELLESGIGLERAHMGIFTELGILYAKFKPDRLMEHLKLFIGKVNIPRLIRACEEQMHWKELTFLYVAYDEYDNAANVMMAHSPEAWEHIYFKDVAVKVSSAEVYYKGVSFYLTEHPDLLNDLLRVLEARIDHSRVVDILRRADHLPLIKEYLTSVQKNNLLAVNEAMNELLVEEEDFDGLRSSITTYDNFDQLALAQRLESHGLIEFRRIAAMVYKQNLKWEKAIALSKSDRLYKDAMETAAQSGKTELVEELLRYFVENKEKECFAACLYTCFDHIKADVALELAWVNGLMDYTFPFLITFVKDTVSKVDLLMQERQDAIDKADSEAKKASQDEAARNAYITLAPLALPAPAMPGQDGGQFGGGGFGGSQFGGQGGYDMGGFQTGGFQTGGFQPNQF